MHKMILFYTQSNTGYPLTSSPRKSLNPLTYPVIFWPLHLFCSHANVSHKALILGGSVRKDKEIKLDFFLMHSLTTSIFLTTFMSQTWITPENKARLLEWKGRFDLLAYAAVGAPQLLVDEIENYVPKFSQAGVGNPWLDIIERGIHKEDDGHTIKTIRALANGERLTARYRDVAEKLELPIVGDMWRKIAVMC